MQAHGAQRELAFAEVVPDRIHRRTEPKIPESNYFIEVVRADEKEINFGTFYSIHGTPLSSGAYSGLSEIVL
jgi:hypothetical protein